MKVKIRLVVSFVSRLDKAKNDFKKNNTCMGFVGVHCVLYLTTKAC